MYTECAKKNTSLEDETSQPLCSSTGEAGKMIQNLILSISSIGDRVGQQLTFGNGRIIQNKRFCLVLVCGERAGLVAET